MDLTFRIGPVWRQLAVVLAVFFGMLFRPTPAFSADDHLMKSSSVFKTAHASGQLFQHAYSGNALIITLDKSLALPTAEKAIRQLIAQAKQDLLWTTNPSIGHMFKMTECQLRIEQDGETLLSGPLELGTGFEYFPSLLKKMSITPVDERMGTRYFADSFQASSNFDMECIHYGDFDLMRKRGGLESAESLLFSYLRAYTDRNPHLRMPSDVPRTYDYITTTTTQTTNGYFTTINNYDDVKQINLFVPAELVELFDNLVERRKTAVMNSNHWQLMKIFVSWYGPETRTHARFRENLIRFVTGNESLPSTGAKLSPLPYQTDLVLVKSSLMTVHAFAHENIILRTVGAPYRDLGAAGEWGVDQLDVTGAVLRCDYAPADKKAEIKTSLYFWWKTRPVKLVEKLSTRSDDFMIGQIGLPINEAPATLADAMKRTASYGSAENVAIAEAPVSDPFIRAHWSATMRKFAANYALMLESPEYKKLGITELRPESYRDVIDLWEKFETSGLDRDREAAYQAKTAFIQKIQQVSISSRGQQSFERRFDISRYTAAEACARD